jgi:hypothetical protein
VVTNRSDHAIQDYRVRSARSSNRHVKDAALNWRPDTDLKLVHIDDEISSHALISIGDNSRVPVESIYPTFQRPKNYIS